MAHDDEAAAVGEDFLECGERTADTGVVGDVAVLVQGNVEVNAHNCLLAVEIVLINSH